MNETFEGQSVTVFKKLFMVITRSMDKKNNMKCFQKLRVRNVLGRGVTLPVFMKRQRHTVYSK